MGALHSWNGSMNGDEAEILRVGAVENWRGKRFSLALRWLSCASLADAIALGRAGCMSGCPSQYSPARRAAAALALRRVQGPWARNLHGRPSAHICSSRRGGRARTGRQQLARLRSVPTARLGRSYHCLQRRLLANAVLRITLAICHHCKP